MPSLKPNRFEELIRIPNVYGYDVAPDGQTAAVTWDLSGQMEIYLVPVRRRGRPRRITSGPESKFAPRFSPDGTRLAFVQDYGGDEHFDLFVYDLRTGTTLNLTPNTPAEQINPEYSWSPDGRALAFVSNREGLFAAYILEIGSLRVRRVTHHAYVDYTAEWSPDGRCLTVATHAVGQEVWTFIVPLDGGAPQIVSGATGPIDASQVHWSPDSRRLAFASNEAGIGGIYTYDIGTGVLAAQTPPSHEAGAPHWSPDGTRIAYTWNVDGNERLALKDLTSGRVHFVGARAGVHSQPRFSRDGQHLFYLYNSARYPSDLWAHRLAGGRRRQVTRSLPERFLPGDFVSPRVARWECDGLTVAGLLYLPKKRSRQAKAPAVVYVHGGPTWQFKNEWYTTVQQLVSEGFVVLAPNYRGSTGSGRAFQEANRFDLGGGDMRDVIAGASYLVQQGYADPGRLAITGASYGGYLTMTALTRHPDVFAAGSALVPFLNWFTEHESEREDLQYWDLQNFGDPVKDADRYRAYSPIFFMENVVAPVQLIAGANDPRCPAAESEQAAAALAEMDVPHEIIIYPGEGHFFRKVENRVDAYLRRVAFLKKHLGMDRPARPKKSIRPVRSPGRGTRRKVPQR